MKNTIKDGLPEGVTLVCNNPYDKLIDITYTLHVKNVPVAYVAEYDLEYHENWRVYNYLTDDKKFINDIMDKYREYCEDVLRKRYKEFRKKSLLKEKSLRDSANAIITEFKKGFVLKSKKGVW